MFEEAVLAHEDAGQVHRLVRVIRRTIGLEAVDADLRRLVEIPSGLGPQRLDVAVVALRLAAEELVAALGRRLVEIDAAARRGRRQRQLVKMQPGELRIRSSSGLMCGRSPNPFAAAIGNCAGLLSRGSKKRPLPCISRFATNAFQYVTVPQAPVHVCWLKPARPYALGNSVAPETFVPVTTPCDTCWVLNALPSSASSASNLPGPPALQHRLHRCHVYAEQRRERREVRGGGDDLADVEVAIRPAVGMSGIARMPKIRATSSAPRA